MDTMELQSIAAGIRRDVVRMIGPNRKGHFGGSMSAADIVTALYFGVMNYRAEDTDWPERDRLILSKGHSCPVQYASLARLGVIPKEELHNLKNLGAMLQGHPDRRKTPGIEVNTGSLGQGLSQGNGIAMALKMDGLGGHVFVIVGDGELNEGQVWEAAMFTVARGLDNVTVIVDKNGMQCVGKTCDRLDSGDLAAKFRGFGWIVREIDGHDMESIVPALRDARDDQVPTCIIAHTVKGKGIPIAEHNAAFHNGIMDDAQYQETIRVLGGEA